MIGIQAQMGHGSHLDETVYHGWPKAVQRMQQLAEIEFDEVAEDVAYIASYLPEQHRLFHTRNISFMPLATKDADGRVWTSILASKDGQPGFMTSDDSRWLHIRANTWQGDPITRTLGDVDSSTEVEALVAGVGVELWSRRRNKLAGVVKKVKWEADQLDLDMRVLEAMGNCPKYITVRGLEPHLSSSPLVEIENLNMSPTDVLPETVINFVQTRDQVFLGTSYIPAGPSDRTLAHLGCNIRGGRPGFVRVRADQRTLVLPDFSGNRHMTSLGNLLTDKHAGLVFPCFETGDVLYLTAEGRTLVGDDAKAVMPRARAIITLFKITGYTLVRNALPFRQSASAAFEPSPYNPPIRYLVEEQEYTSQSDLKAKLSAIEFHRNDESIDPKDADLATFTFEASSPIKVQAGQYVVLDNTALVGMNMYRHMSKGDEKAPNDDGVRTWTIARPPTSLDPRKFSLTIRKVSTGRVSSRLFSFGAYWDSKKRENSGDYVPGLEMLVLGIGGTFLLPPKSEPLLLLAGGIGITPFLAFLAKIVANDSKEVWDVELVVSTREPGIIVDLLRRALNGLSSSSLRLKLYLFTSSTVDTELSLPNTSIEIHRGRLSPDPLRAIEGLEQRNVYLCGPPAFESAALMALAQVGIKEVDVTRESFAF